MIDEEKIDGSVKIESEKKIEKREEKKSDGEKIVGTVKFESEEKRDDVVAEVQNVATEVAKAEKIKEEVTCDGEKKEKEDGNNGGAIEKQVARETKAKKEKEKEAIFSGSAIKVAQVIKPVEEKLLAGQVEQVIKTVNEKQFPIETKIEKKEGGDNSGCGSVEQVIKLVKGTIDIECHYVKAKQVEKNNCMGIQLHGLQRNKRWWHFHPVKRSILQQRQLLVKEYG